ncbi:MAG: AAA family ATPase [Thermoprotei archaeon]
MEQRAPEMLVKEIILEDFMSYEYARVPLRPGLNVITGPNGSGKSSILIGLSVALGQTYTERAKKLAELVRRGEDAARVSIVFDNSPRNGKRPVPFPQVDDYIVTRYVKSDGSYWFEAGGRAISKVELNSVLARFGINPNDSLIIMQQNMIERFSSLSPQQILELFEDAVGVSPLRSSLLEARKRLEEVRGPTTEEVEAGKKNLDYWSTLHERYQKKIGLQQRLRQLEGELAWRALQDAVDSRSALEERAKKIQAQAEELEAKLQSYSKEVKTLRQALLAGPKTDELLDTLIETAVGMGRTEEAQKQLRLSLSDIKSRMNKTEAELQELRSRASAYERPPSIRGEEDIRTELAQAKAALEALSDVNESTEQAYQRLSKELAELLTKAETAERNRQAVLSEISDREKRWAGALHDLVELVNAGYKEVLSSVGGSGYLRLVGLKEGADPSQAGLELYAGFRGTSPVKLNPFTHSGGERSVTIMAFLISLQQHVLSPIRAVDEFDVHMDPANKEVIAGVLIKELSKKKDVQYIYITPGPLPKLPNDVHLLLVQKVEGRSKVMEARRAVWKA